MSAPPRVLFYVQHLLGIGHLARAGRIAGALARDGFKVTLVTGGLPVEGFLEEGVEEVRLPPLVAGEAGFSTLNDAEGRPATDAYKAARRERLLSLYEALKPDIVLIEAFPFGRRQVRFELLPLIDRIEKSRPRPRLVSSIRDLLQARTKPGRDRETADIVKAHFDAVLVHGDPAFARLEDSFALAAEIADKVRYTGLVAPARIVPAPDRHDIVVSAGGGAVGRRVMEAAAGAARLLDPALSWLLITGPNLPEADFEALSSRAGPNVSLARFRRDFTGVLANARLSISQAGYNTVGDILLAGCRSILLPFETGGETEQRARAERLEALGRAVMLEEDKADAQTMAQAVTRALALPDPAAIVLDRHGAEGTARELRALLDAP